MDSNVMNQLKSSNTETIEAALREFIDQNSQSYTFPWMDMPNARKELWEALFLLLDNHKSDTATLNCLIALRILSRDKTGVESCLTEKHLLTLVKYSGLLDESLTRELNYPVLVEAMKCLCNVLFNANSSVNTIESFNVLEALISRLSNGVQFSNDLKLFDMKLVFLLTALSPDNRVKLHCQLNGLSTLCCLLQNNVEELIIRFPKISESKIEREIEHQITKEDEENKLKFCCEILKTLFNMLLSQKSENQSNDQLKTFEVLVVQLKELLLYNTNNPLVRNLHSDVINLLTLVPAESYKALFVEGCPITPSIVHIDHPAMAAIAKIVYFLDKSLTNVEAGEGSSIDLLSPVLLTLLNISKSDRIFRKYLRKVVLPNLTEVFKRPEEGDTLRNKLCRLLTSPVTSVTDLVADWLFVLCKESVGRMVKYTGYGNAAGLFARRGLLGASHTYSSDSEDSDTEEYLLHKDKINPIVGCRMETQPNPLENMTYEQKEFLAMELVNTIDKLQRGGVIQPCRVGKDGRPEPVEHILELQTEIPEQKGKFQSNDSN